MAAPTQMNAPGVQLMTAESLTQIPGVVIQEVLQGINVAMEVLDGGFQAASKFNVYAVPSGARIAREHEEQGAWTPSLDEIKGLPQAFFAQEESSCFLRVLLAACGGLNLRPLKLHILGGAGEAFTVDRPCKLGGCCCAPFELTVSKGQQVVGKVVEDWRCIEQNCLCLYRHDILAAGKAGAAPEKKFQLVVPLSCCAGRVNNCCGATCCKPQLIMDVETPEGKLVSTVVKTYGKGPGCAGGLLRCAFEADNYIVEFPPNSTEEERAALVAAVFQTEYLYFSRKGGDNDK